MGKLNVVSDFLQEIAVQAVSLSDASIQKQLDLAPARIEPSTEVDT